MANGITLTQTRIHGGIWEGVMEGAKKGQSLQVFHQDRLLGEAKLSAMADAPGQFSVRVPIPAELLSEGVQTFLIRSGDETLARFSVNTGVAVEDDLRAELALLRAELDLLKRAFRRHCVETGAA